MNKDLNSNQTCMQRFSVFDKLKKLLDLDDLDPSGTMMAWWVREHPFFSEYILTSLCLL